jgi:hypothetical protein
MLNPYSPTATPANTMPTIWGMRNLPITIGAKRMISITMKKINVGSVMGKAENIVVSLMVV